MSAIRLHRAAGIEMLADEAFYALLERARDDLVEPFAEPRMMLIADVAAQLLSGPARANSPAAAHFAFWIRRAGLQRLAEEFFARLPAGCIARPRGLVFHLPPQNVETMFLYSWAIAYLLGNANVVRLPSQLPDEAARLLRHFVAALGTSGERSQFFISYPAESEASRAISARADARIVWGGDAKVALFAPLPLRNGGKAIWFGDRFSYAAIDGDALAALDAKGRRALAERFGNDLYVFDQMACASPHILYVVGGRTRHEPAVRALLADLAAVAAERGLIPAAAQAIRKMIAADAAAARGEATAIIEAGPALTAIEMTVCARQEQRVGGGFLELCFIEALGDLRALVCDHDQTLTYFGFAPEALAALTAAACPRGLSRIVPIGQALDFDAIWDGYDLRAELTRLVRIA